MQFLEAVDRDSQPLQPGVYGRLQALVGQAAAARLQRAVHAPSSNRGDNLGPVGAEIGLTPDQSHLTGAQAGEGIHNLEALLGGQLARTGAAGPLVSSRAALCWLTGWPARISSPRTKPSH